MQTSGDYTHMTASERLRRLVPRSSRIQALLLGLAAVLAFMFAVALGRSTAAARVPLRTAPPLVPRSQAVEISGLPAARALPALRPQPIRRKPPAAEPPAPRAAVKPSPPVARPAAPPPTPTPPHARPKPVVIVGEG